MPGNSFTPSHEEGNLPVLRFYVQSRSLPARSSNVFVGFL
jgi:hypothetical protein